MIQKHKKRRGPSWGKKSAELKGRKQSKDKYDKINCIVYVNNVTMKQIRYNTYQ